jgi:16S rRNA processing protein RimM
LMAERLAVGRIQGPHGVQGFVKVLSLSGEQAHFFRLRRLSVRQGERYVSYDVQEVKGGGSLLAIKLSGIDGPEAAARLRGLEIWVDRAEANPLGDGEYYLADLCRCRLYRGAAEIGRVIGVCEGGAAELLEVEEAGGRRFLVPFVEAFVGAVDVEQARIEVKEGFPLP